jgi:hypothetical protein
MIEAIGEVSGARFHTKAPKGYYVVPDRVGEGRRGVYQQDRVT